MNLALVLVISLTILPKNYAFSKILKLAFNWLKPSLINSLALLSLITTIWHKIECTSARFLLLLGCKSGKLAFVLSSVWPSRPFLSAVLAHLYRCTMNWYFNLRVFAERRVTIEFILVNFFRYSW